MTERIAVLGGGTWGSTLATHLAGRGHDVAIWEYAASVADRLKRERTLPTLPELRLPDSVLVSNDMKEALADRPVILSATPSHTVRATFQSAARSGLAAGALVISVSKGIDGETLGTMSQVIGQMFTDCGDIVILSGPSHAEEVSLGRPVALVAASRSALAASRVATMFSADSFRVYTGGDPIGVELGGALKNVYALACGVVDGLGLGDNTKAALMTRGLAEMTRLGTRLGAQALTFFGLSGLGDMIVTCGSRHSRNRLMGEKLGSGKSLDQALGEMTMVAEGVNTTKSAYNLALSKNVEMPIVRETYRILFENKSPRDSIKDLMSRQVGAEMEGIAL